MRQLSFILILLISQSCSLLVFGQTARVTHYSEKCNVANAGGQYTSVTTAPNGDIYSAWMDESRNLKVSKITISTNVNTVVVLRSNMQENKYHVRPSIVLDKLGYVHVAADMHNQNWVYYRSLNPYDITPSNFEMVTPPGYLITYPNFFKDKNDELYITFRHKVKPAPNQFSVGSSGGGIIRYNADTKVFTMLGGTDHGFDKTVVWVNMGGAGTFNVGTGITTPSHYQQPNIRLFFDNNNRMHMVCNLINQPTTGASDANTHVLYAYSDDGGNSFKRLGGNPITSLPMGPNTGPSLMTVVTSRTQADITADCYIGAFDTNKPVVSWRSAGEGSRIAFWNGSTWQLIAPGGSSAGRMLYSRRNGETLFFAPAFNYLHRTFNGGTSFQQYTFNPKYQNSKSFFTESEVLDADYYIKTGNVRYQFSNSTTEDSIFLSTIPFTPVLPLQLLSFNAKIDLNKIILHWETSNEVNVSHFVLEKNVTGNSWQPINSIFAKGNNTGNTFYDCYDYQPIAQNLYRLKMIDKDGQFCYSKVVNVNFEKSNSLHYDLQTKSVITNGTSLSKVEFILINSLGQIAKKGVIQNNKFSMNLLPSGIYHLHFSNGLHLKFLHEN
jgi:hypothetical protein